MMKSRFCRYVLRTTELDAARLFYNEVVGLDLGATSSQGARGEATSMLESFVLHEEARARGAPPHWLGQIGVTDLEAKASRLVELGAERLGPTLTWQDGVAFANFRDPLGAVVGLLASTQRPERGPVVWHQLHTRELDRSWPIYSELFGWTHTDTLDAPDVVGGHRRFAWDDSGKSVGSVANTARWPGVHPHWMFYFPVADLDVSTEKVRARGGRVVGTITLPSGDRLAPCDDPQGAAFGLYQSASQA